MNEYPSRHKSWFYVLCRGYPSNYLAHTYSIEPQSGRATSSSVGLALSIFRRGMKTVESRISLLRLHARCKRTQCKSVCLKIMQATASVWNEVTAACTDTQIVYASMFFDKRPKCQTQVVRALFRYMLSETRKAALGFGESQDASQSCPSVNVCYCCTSYTELQNAPNKP